jgi:hypothetical protein
MSDQIHSQDSPSDFKEVWMEMEEIEPLTPSPSKKEIDASLEAYREAAKSDTYMFGEYDDYEAYKDCGDIPN